MGNHGILNSSSLSSSSSLSVPCSRNESNSSGGSEVAKTCDVCGTGGWSSSSRVCRIALGGCGSSLGATQQIKSVHIQPAGYIGGSTMFDDSSRLRRSQTKQEDVKREGLHASTRIIDANAGDICKTEILPVLMENPCGKTAILKILKR